jgi:O-antigen/teichoic acid export membrane protein
MIIGHRSGATALGTFAVSNELASLPTNELAAPIMRAVFPGYAMMSSDRSRLAHGFLKVLSLMLLLIIPAAAGVAVLADIFVFVLLGAKWEAAVPLVQVLAIVGAMRAVQSNAGTVYLAIDKPHLMTALTFVSVVVGLGSFSILLAYQSVEVAVWALAATAVLTGILHFALMQRLLSLPAGSLLLPFFRPLLGVVAMCFVLHALADLLWTGQRHDILTSAGFLLAGVLVGALTYMLIVYGAWRSAGRSAESPEQAVLTAAGEVMRRLRPSIAERT